MANTINLEGFATEVVTKLRDAGHTAFFAGGCVRDKLLNAPPKDYDVATSALPETVRQIFGHRKTIAIGQSFGVITVLGPRPLQVEVATFRSDGEYTDGRHPNQVVFSSPEEDAARRDFTINGMFYDPINQQVIDFVGGRSDLDAKLIRAIGNPADRIEEDRLRMLRAVRFAATYEFEIETSTLTAIQQRFEKIDSVSQERITHELQRMLCHRNRQHALQLLLESRLLSQVLPAVDEVAVEPEKWKRLLRIVDVLEEPVFAVVIAALFGPPGANYSATQVTEECRRLKVSNDVRKSTEWITTNHSVLNQAEDFKFSELQPLLIHPDIHNALSLLSAVATVDGVVAKGIEHCHEKLRLPANQLDPKPFIRGEDLAEVGIVPGPAFAEMLKLVRDAQLNGEVSTKAEAIALVREHS